ncbi:Clathrin adaptor complex small chain family protein [Coccidioides posadasii C735 delta SOWgp]|nr:Clathrin adaptor complex small chain family protein [Coccidioides posadasii C735 delta SOWgp]EER23426.1 Clathrin adaptor complex small chain family protein [Coccidioides posadasii C735 delta SOWgp]|eukprot:XP_003065571.1 Clathrin adaptor complex small chain family protein [Coccidioides posadasii C735 delta SOWgp]
MSNKLYADKLIYGWSWPDRLCPVTCNINAGYQGQISCWPAPQSPRKRAGFGSSYQSVPAANMINAVLVFNNSGQPRLTKFYTQLDTQTQQRLIAQIYSLVSQRPPSACNFLPLPPLLSQGADTNPTLGHSDAPTQITYRTYATLSFILISTSTESPLALIDLIQVFVEALDRLFENVCELDLIFGFETMHAVLAEMIVGGVVIETNLDRIVQGVRSQEGSKGRRKAVEAASSGIGRTGIPGLGVPWR